MSKLYVRDETGEYTPASYTTILEAAPAAARRKFRRNRTITNPSDTGQLFQSLLWHHGHEVFAVCFLTSRHQLIASELMFQGTIDGASVYPRTIARRCLELEAAAIIVAHNHPSGVCEPSAADRGITRRLKEAMTLIDVRLLDHLVVGGENTTSFAERGWL